MGGPQPDEQAFFEWVTTTAPAVVARHLPELMRRSPTTQPAVAAEMLYEAVDKQVKPRYEALLKALFDVRPDEQAEGLIIAMLRVVSRGQRLALLNTLSPEQCEVVQDLTAKAGAEQLFSELEAFLEGNSDE